MPTIDLEPWFQWVLGSPSGGSNPLDLFGDYCLPNSGILIYQRVWLTWWEDGVELSWPSFSWGFPVVLIDSQALESWWWRRQPRDSRQCWETEFTMAYGTVAFRGLDMDLTWNLQVHWLLISLKWQVGGYPISDTSNVGIKGCLNPQLER